MIFGDMYGGEDSRKKRKGGWDLGRHACMCCLLWIVEWKIDTIMLAHEVFNS